MSTRGELSTFASSLWEPADIIEWRGLGGGLSPLQGWLTAGDLPGAVDVLTEHNQGGRNIYAGINPRLAVGRSGDDSVVQCRAVFADFDSLDKGGHETDEEAVLQRVLEAHLPPATLTIHSGHGIHAYWRLTEPVDGATFRHVQKRLAATLWSDPAICNPERMMRLPGFLNVKADPVPCYILRHDPGRVFPLTRILSVLKSLPPRETFATRPAGDLEVKGRATLYAARWPGEPEDSRNQAAFRHTRQLLNDFSLDEVDAWSILADWNHSNQPPLDEEELRQVFNSAVKGTPAKPQGCKLVETRPTKSIAKASVVPQPSGALADLLEATIEGRRVAIDWPWDDVGRLTEALIPGTVTVLCGPKGSTKTFFLLQSLIFWTQADILCAMLVLEEDVEHCLLRCLAQLSGNPELTKTKWVRHHPEETRRAHADHARMIDLLGSRMMDTPDSEMTLPEISRWIDSRAAEGARIIIVDPVTAAKQTDSPWKTDATFINDVKRIARKRGVSVILATHPVKGGSSMVGLDSLAGSSAWVRFAQTILWLEAHDDKDVTVMLLENRVEQIVNRTLHVLAARNSFGAGKRIALLFTDKLRLESRGMILRRKEVRE